MKIPRSLTLLAVLGVVAMSINSHGDLCRFRCLSIHCRSTGMDAESVHWVSGTYCRSRAMTPPDVQPPL